MHIVPKLDEYDEGEVDLETWTKPIRPKSSGDDRLVVVR